MTPQPTSPYLNLASRPDNKNKDKDNKNDNNGNETEHNEGSDAGEWDPNLGEEEEQLGPRQATPEGADKVVECCRCPQNGSCLINTGAGGTCPDCGHEGCDDCKEGKDSLTFQG